MLEGKKKYVMTSKKNKMENQKESWQIRDEDEYYIDCIGEDNKKHICYPWEDKCYCGVKILRKKLLRDDWKLFSCWECTY